MIRPLTLEQTIFHAAYMAGYQGRLDENCPIGNSYDEGGFPDVGDSWEHWARGWREGYADQLADEASASADYDRFYRYED